mmetsp:Transcript_3755/g.6174  ORF Transcript_3755/g.6174 Transcript_3755/m.6174 type:complete len:102 (-) Transcript_3755:436-741(-)
MLREQWLDTPWGGYGAPRYRQDRYGSVARSTTMLPYSGGAWGDFDGPFAQEGRFELPAFERAELAKERAWEAREVANCAEEEADMAVEEAVEEAEAGIIDV